MENQYHQLSHHQTLSAREAGHRVQDGLGGSTKVFNITRPLLFFQVRKSLYTNHWQTPHLRMLVDMGGWKRRQPLPVAPRTGAPPQLRQSLYQADWDWEGPATCTTCTAAGHHAAELAAARSTRLNRLRRALYWRPAVQEVALSCDALLLCGEHQDSKLGQSFISQSFDANF